MTAVIPDVLADPVGVVVALVAAAEPALSRTAVEDLVISVAAGRAKRRKLAGALAERPAVLSDGRSPAPRVIGDLLIALRKAGATVISPPVCAKCGKDLATLQRRGQDWYCGVCGPRRERCGACGSTRPVTFRARDGQPRCGQCPPGDGRDPAAVIAGIVAAIDPAVPAEAVVSAVQAAAAVSRLTTGHIQASGDNVSIRLGREPVALPEPLNALALQLVAVRHGHAAIGGQETSPWLFPGGQPGRPISACQLAERLRQLGVQSGQSRSAALFQLATDLPAALLARMLGIHITVAVAWQRASAGDWMAYAADVSRRGTSPAQHAADTPPTPT